MMSVSHLVQEIVLVLQQLHKWEDGDDIPDELEVKKVVDRGIKLSAELLTEAERCNSL